ncbi:Mannan endo-1,4-beta-mannosidase precursor [compost metagenome]
MSITYDYFDPGFSESTTSPVINKGPDFPSLKPINPSASAEVRHALNYLYSIQGKQILSGIHNWVDKPMGGMNVVKNEQGVYPGIHGVEVGIFDPTYTEDMIADYMQIIVNEIINVYKMGGISVITYHQSYPGGNRTWENVQRKTTNGEFENIITPGTSIYAAWEKEVDRVAEVIKCLRNRNIPVIFRPYHEMNGQWFWYGCKDKFNVLWNNIQDRFINVHQLHNIIWMWNPNAANGYVDVNTGVKVFEFSDPRTFPGIDKVDILGVDIYNRDYQQKYHDDLNTLSQGKIIAIGENGQLPTPEIITNQPKYVYFMTWPDYWAKEGNTLTTRKATFNDPRAITMDKVIKPSFIGYSGDEIHYVNLNDFSRVIKGLTSKPEHVGQIAIHRERPYIAIHAFDQSGWKPLSRDGSYILESESGFRFKQKVSDTGALYTESLTVGLSNFNQPNGSPLNQFVAGQPWLFPTGAKFTIKNNKATTLTKYNNDIAIVDTGINDFTFEANVSSMWNLLDPSKIDAPWNTTYGSACIIARSSVDAKTFIGVTIRHGKVSLGGKINNNGISINSSTLNTTNGQVFNILIELHGRDISVYIDGTLKITHTLTLTEYNTFKTLTYAGIRYDRSGDASIDPTWNNLRIEKLY